jgi:serine protease AprX
MKQVLLFVLLPFTLFAQKSSSVYFISFKDKNNSLYSISKPLEILSEKAMARRAKWNIQVDESDLPVNTAYIDEVCKLKVKYLSSSKWLNGICIEAKDPATEEKIAKLEFVRTITKVAGITKEENQKYHNTPSFSEVVEPVIPSDVLNIYGKAATQIKMIHGQELHELGYHGNNMTIAVLDAGFNNANQIGWFKRMEEKKKVLAIRDFVDHDDYVFDASSHGLQVLSCMAGCDSGLFIGTCPDANFLLLRTEDAESEQLIEEINWATGAEFADSAGADLITSSLGYNLFDDAIMNHTWKELDGHSSFCSKAAAMAVKKGILVVNSAGNNGADEWRLIGFPADAKEVLTVGAVDADRTIAYFSSMGTGNAGLLKPDICGMGIRAAVYSPNGEINYENGTSFSAPIIAGMTACLMQAYPEKSPAEINEAIRESSDQYDRPDTVYGYGIPDFYLANLLLKLKPADEQKDQLIDISFNSSKKLFTFYLYSSAEQKYTYRFLDENGKIIREGKVESGTRKFRRFYIEDLQLPETTAGFGFILKNEKGEEFVRLFR